MSHPRKIRVIASLIAFTGFGVAATAQFPQIPTKVVRTFTHPAGYGGGLAWHTDQFNKDTMWVGDVFAANIWEYDPYTGTQIKTLPAPNSKIRDLTHDGIDLWAASWFSPPTPSIFRIATKDGTVLSSLVAPFSGGKSDGMAWDGTLWIGEEANRIHQYDTNRNVLIQSLSVPATPSFNPRGLAWDNVSNNIWAGYQSAGVIRQHSPITGNVLAEFKSPYGNFQQGLAWDGWFLWATGGSSTKTVSQIDVTPPFMELLSPLKGGNNIQFKCTMANPNELFVVAWSGSGTAGFQVGSTTVPLTFDGFTVAGLQLIAFFQATTDASGTATTPGFVWPPVPSGLFFWVCGATVDNTGISAVTEPFKYVTN